MSASATANSQAGAPRPARYSDHGEGGIKMLKRLSARPGWPSPVRAMVAVLAMIALGTMIAASTVSAAPAPKTLATFTVDRSDTSNPKNIHAWRVPNGVKQVRFDAFGATGGGRGTFVAGGGGEAAATYAVTGGQVFQIVVGGTGGAFGIGGLNGGGTGSGGGNGGGGSSDVRVCADADFNPCDLSERIVVAGGGGGLARLGGGGAGGGVAGNPGGGCCGGGGGTQTTGGAAVGGSSTAGTFGFGGDADPGQWGGAGGGGGWYGGGGSFDAGGGGGSGHISPLALSGSLTTGVWSGGDGKVVIYKG